MTATGRNNVAQQLLDFQEGVVTQSCSAWVAKLRGGEINAASGVAGAGVALLVRALLVTKRQLLVVAPDGVALDAVAHDIDHVLAERDGRDRCLGFPGAEEDPYARLQPDRAQMMRRLATLARLAQGAAPVVVTNVAALYRRVPPRAALLGGAVTIDVDTEVDLSALSLRLQANGYVRVPVVEDPASYAMRGSVLDIWAAGAPQPVRFELFGDLVLSAKYFDAETQRTAGELRSAFFPPGREVVLNEVAEARATGELRALCDALNYPSSKARRLIEEVASARTQFGLAGFLPAFFELESLWDYLSDDALTIFLEPAVCLRELRRQLGQIQASEAQQVGLPHYPMDALCLSEEDIAARVEGRTVVALASSLVRGPAAAPLLERLAAPPFAVPSLGQSDHAGLRLAVKQARTQTGKGAALEPLLEHLLAWQEAGLRVELVARSSSQASRLASLLRHRGVELSSAEEPAGADAVMLRVGRLARGVVAPAEGFVWVTEEEIFGQRAHTPRRGGRGHRDALADLRALAVGDHVVHVEHGVGRYQGLVNRPGPNGSALELVVVEYTGGKLFLPVYRLNQIQKFSGGDGPKLDRLGGQTFAKTKARARRKAREMADELLRLYAERHAAQKEPLPPPDDDYLAFEAAFPYEETSDQAAAILDVSADLESPRVMDRLVCGDVGFGKTEVALRAAFRVASAGQQVALLCPTTVLAQQHFLTFQRRLADTAIQVRVLSRFQSAKETKATLEGLRQGTVDIVVGTHRVLSKDLQFARLGLLVVDEEQRFGVTHKERIKQMRSSVDALMLTATPIPRTLQQAIGGLREMSIISTPPAARRSVRTVVAQFDDGVIREAIERELSRGGQVYYVYNRIEGLHERAARIAALFPQARIGVGHGQMKESALEKTMLDFMEGRFDILVATAIVESGLDIPRANTMLIDRADLFGLAQLYQLRGRVGRSVERAFCYLLVPAPSELTDEARARIEALERYTELGSGFQIATLDMELRGAGDLLGAEQSGTVASVGLELFSRMLEEAAAELRGEESVHDIEPELSFDVEALLPDTYVDDVGVRLSLYKRLASAASSAEVVRLGAEMEDRFGAPPREARAFVELMTLKPTLRRLKVNVCEGTSAGVSLRFREDTPLDPLALVQAVARDKARYRLYPDGRLLRRRRESEQRLGSLELAAALLEELNALLAPGPARDPGLAV